MLGNTQPNKTLNGEKKKSGRGRRFLFNALGLIILLVLAVLGGYRSALVTRLRTQDAVITKQLGEQFQYALVDIEFKRYENARQRLEFIIAHDASFPGAQEKLTEVLVQMNVPTPTVAASLTPTPDFSGAEQAFAQAQQRIAAQDWPGAISALDQMRKLDPNYQTPLVDGMYYFALRNYGYDLITRQGNLEGGIYQVALAEHFGPLDRDASGLREGARFYLIGASFWELDWSQAVFYFEQVYGGWSGLWDGTMTASERYYIASMRYGDDLISRGEYCAAYEQYVNAQKISQLDQSAAKGFNQASRQCYPATETPTLSITSTTGGPTEIPTDTQPAPPPTDTPPPPTDTPPTP